MMKATILVFAAIMLSITTVYADPFADMHGKTFVMVMPDGSKYKFAVGFADTWETTAPDGNLTSGRFELQDAKTICFTRTTPIPALDDQATNCMSYTTDTKRSSVRALIDHAGKVTAIVAKSD